MKYYSNRLALTLLSVIFAATACNNNPPAAETTDTIIDPPVAMPVAEQQVIDTPVVNAKRDTVIIKTSAGNITVALYNETPLHRANFVKLVKEKYYDGVLFHRVIKGFMIQTGDPDSKNAVPGAMYGSGGPGYLIPSEISTAFKHKKGALAAARTDNPERASSGSQFYICHVDVPQLDGQYTVFGETIEGLDIVDKIATTPTAPGDRPLKDIKIISTTLKSDMPAAKADKKETKGKKKAE